MLLTFFAPQQLNVAHNRNARSFGQQDGVVGLRVSQGDAGGHDQQVVTVKAFFGEVQPGRACRGRVVWVIIPDFYCCAARQRSFSRRLPRAGQAKDGDFLAFEVMKRDQPRRVLSGS